MLSAEEITPIPEEQELIQALSARFEPFYNPLLLHHNFEHPHDEVMPEVLRLDKLFTGSPAPSRRRRQGIAFSLTHDSKIDEPLVPGDGFKTKEERSGQLAAEHLPDFGYDRTDISIVRSMIDKTGVGTTCETEQEIEARRADLLNVAGLRIPFLATAVKIFGEEIQMAEKYGFKKIAWRPYVLRQEAILRDLLAQDLSLPHETIRRGRGPFNRDALRNVSWISRNKLRDPLQFVTTYGFLLKKILPAFEEIEPHILAQTA